MRRRLQRQHHDILPDSDRRDLADNNYSAGAEVLLRDINMTHDTHYLFASLILTIRRDHSSWASPSGAMLLGGLYSKNTSERIQEDGTSVRGFPLEYDLT